MSHITSYYLQQAQTGSGLNYYAGSSSQKGAGIGSFLGGLFRSIFPFIKQGAQTVGREAMRAGSHILADVVSGEVPLRNSVQAHIKQAGQNLSERMKGNGIKRLRSKSRNHSTRKSRGGQTRAQKRKIDTSNHIF